VGLSAFTPSTSARQTATAGRFQLAPPNLSVATAPAEAAAGLPTGAVPLALPGQLIPAGPAGANLGVSPDALLTGGGQRFLPSPGGLDVGGASITRQAITPAARPGGGVGSRAAESAAAGTAAEETTPTLAAGQQAFNLTEKAANQLFNPTSTFRSFVDNLTSSGAPAPATLAEAVQAYRDSNGQDWSDLSDLMQGNPELASEIPSVLSGPAASLTELLQPVTTGGQTISNISDILAGFPELAGQIPALLAAGAGPAAEAASPLLEAAATGAGALTAGAPLVGAAFDIARGRVPVGSVPGLLTQAGKLLKTPGINDISDLLAGAPELAGIGANIGATGVAAGSVFAPAATAGATAAELSALGATGAEIAGTGAAGLGIEAGLLGVGELLAGLGSALALPLAVVGAMFSNDASKAAEQQMNEAREKMGSAKDARTALPIIARAPDLPKRAEPILAGTDPAAIANLASEGTNVLGQGGAVARAATNLGLNVPWLHAAYANAYNTYMMAMVRLQGLGAITVGTDPMAATQNAEGVFEGGGINYSAGGVGLTILPPDSMRGVIGVNPELLDRYEAAMARYLGQRTGPNLPEPTGPDWTAQGPAGLGA